MRLTYWVAELEIGACFNLSIYIWSCIMSLSVEAKAKIEEEIEKRKLNKVKEQKDSKDVEESEKKC